MASPSLHITGGRAGTGDAVVIGPSRALQAGQHNRDQMINLDVQEMRSNAQSAARAKAMQDKIDEDALKADVMDTGRFQPYYSEAHVNPTKQRLLQNKGPLTRGVALNEATNLKNAGMELSNLNKAIDTYLTETETTYPKAYDKGQLDKFMTDEALRAVKSGKRLEADDIAAIGEKARQNYHSQNAPQLYEDWKKETQARKNAASLNRDPTGLLRTKQDVKTNPYIDIFQVKDKNGNIQYKTRFAGERIYRDQIADPKLNNLYKEQKIMQLKDDGIKAAYDKRLAEAGEIVDPGKKQQAIDEAEFDFFIEPFMGGREGWAMTDMSQEQIAQFREQPKLTDSEREIQKASELRPLGAENRYGKTVNGKVTGFNRGKALALGGTFTKEDAAGITVGGPGQTVYARGSDGYLHAVPNFRAIKGVGRNYEITTENIVRGGLFMQDPKTGKTYIFDQKNATRPSLKKKELETYFTKRGFMDGAPLQDELFNTAIEDINKKGLVPVTYGRDGKWLPVKDAADMYAIGRVDPAEYMQLDISELQDYKPKSGGAPTLGPNNAKKSAAEAVLDLLYKTPGTGGKVYVPLQDAGTAKAAAQTYVGRNKWDLSIQDLKEQQRQLNYDQYIKSVESTGKTTTAKKKGKKTF